MNYFIKFFIFIILTSCTSKDCSLLPGSFPSSEDGLNTVESANFNFNDQVDTSESSWIRGAGYYSCDAKTGFLILITDSTSYVHQEVPLSVWENFKNANSFGSFYNRNIKGQYQLNIK